MIAGLRGRLRLPALRRLRLVDAVVVAAGAMLVMKLVSLAAGSSPPGSPQSASRPDPAGAPPFAHVLAHARTNYTPPDPATTGSVGGGEARPAAARAESPPNPPPQRMAAGEPAPPASPAERALLERLGERREELQQRGRDLDTRTKLLENAERRLESRLNELKALEERNEAGATRRGDTEAGALKNLVIMYEAMKPKEAARVFERLSLDVLVPVVLQMNPRKMAEVLAAMSPEAAERLTVALAQRARGPGGPGGAEPRGPQLPPNELPSIEPPRAAR